MQIRMVKGIGTMIPPQDEAMVSTPKMTTDNEMSICGGRNSLVRFHEINAKIIKIKSSCRQDDFSYGCRGERI